MSTFANPPHPVPEGVLSPFQIFVYEDSIAKLHHLLRTCPIASQNWENSRTDGSFGVSRDWVSTTATYWQQKFDWRRQEAAMNNIPNFKVEVKDDDAKSYSIHFAALFSQNPNAIPILLLHGWPGSFMEFLPILQSVHRQYSLRPADLPYHLIVPSLVGFGFSSPPPHDHGFTYQDNARMLHKMMGLLGFANKGYAVQGGDLGSIVAFSMAAQFKEVKAVHVNLLLMAEPPANLNSEEAKDSDAELEAMRMTQSHFKTGLDYLRIQGNRPSTIGMVVASSPIALLAWIGEKMIEWSDDTPSTDLLLTNISIYWFTGCYPTSIWCYRDVSNTSKPMGCGWADVNVPMGVSWFPKEVNPPRAWIESTGKVSWFRAHEKGGHFAALEEPETLWKDITDFLVEKW